MAGRTRTRVEGEETAGLVGQPERQGERPMIVAHVKTEDARSGNRGEMRCTAGWKSRTEGEDDERFGVRRKRNWWWKKREVDERRELKKKKDKKEGEVKLRLETAITVCNAVWQKYRHIWVVPFVTAVTALPTIMMTSSEIYASGYVIYAANATYAPSEEPS